MLWKNFHWSSFHIPSDHLGISDLLNQASTLLYLLAFTLSFKKGDIFVTTLLGRADFSRFTATCCLSTIVINQGMAPFSLVCLVLWSCLSPSKLSTLYLVSGCGAFVMLQWGKWQWTCSQWEESFLIKVWSHNGFSGSWVATENPRQCLCCSIEFTSLLAAAAQQVLLFNHWVPTAQQASQAPGQKLSCDLGRLGRHGW